jgi:hypothetical protein
MLLGPFRPAFAAYLTVKLWTTLHRHLLAAFSSYLLIKIATVRLSCSFSTFPSCLCDGHFASSAFANAQNSSPPLNYRKVNKIEAE